MLDLTTDDWNDAIDWVCGTPILVRKYPNYRALNDALTTEIGDVSRLPVVGRRRDGALEEHDFFKRRSEARVLLETWLLNGIDLLNETSEFLTDQDWSISGWVLVCEFGGSVPPHCHPNSIWSGVYYVDTDTDDDDRRSGELELIDPRAGADYFVAPGRPFSRSYFIRPEPGVAVFFPSWLRHYVHPYFGNSNRVSIPFNVAASNSGRA